MTDYQVFRAAFERLGLPLEETPYRLADGIDRIALFLGNHDDTEVIEYDFVESTGELTEVHEKQDAHSWCNCR